MIAIRIGAFQPIEAERKDEAIGMMAASGPFAWSRHPLNVAPVFVFALSPKMTTKLALFTGISAAYLVVGLFHEESRLLHGYGQPYAEYQRSGVPFYLPRRPCR